MGGHCKCNQTNEKADSRIKKLSPDKSCSRDTGGKSLLILIGDQRLKWTYFKKLTAAACCYFKQERKTYYHLLICENANTKLWLSCQSHFFDPLVPASSTHSTEQFKVNIVVFVQYNQLISKVYRCCLKFSLVPFFTEESRMKQIWGQHWWLSNNFAQVCSFFFFKGLFYFALSTANFKTSLKNVLWLKRQQCFFLPYESTPYMPSREPRCKNPTLPFKALWSKMGSYLITQNVKITCASWTILTLVASRTGITGGWFHLF